MAEERVHLQHAMHDIDNWAHASSCAFCQKIAADAKAVLQLADETEGHLAVPEAELQAHPAVAAIRQDVSDMTEVRDLAAVEAHARASGQPVAEAAASAPRSRAPLLDSFRGKDAILGNGPFHIRDAFTTMKGLVPRPLQILAGKRTEEPKT